MAAEVPQIRAEDSADAEDAQRRPMRKTPKTPKMPQGSEQEFRNQLSFCLCCLLRKFCYGTSFPTRSKTVILIPLESFFKRPLWALYNTARSTWRKLTCWVILIDLPLLQHTTFYNMNQLGISSRVIFKVSCPCRALQNNTLKYLEYEKI